MIEKEDLEIIKMLLEIFNLLKPLVKLAWTKIKELFQKEKKPSFNKLIKLLTRSLEYFRRKNTIAWI